MKLDPLLFHTTSAFSRLGYYIIMRDQFVVSSNDAFGLRYKTSYNVAPSQLIPVQTKDNALLMKWSFAPSWKKDMNLINCHSETMHKKSSFRKTKRCVIFHNGWYEWQ